MKSSKVKRVNMRNYFEISRFLLLLKLELFKSRKAVLMTLVISIGLLFFAGLLLEIIVERPTVYSSHDENFVYNLLISGFILSSLSFNDLGNSLRRHSYLTLPVSTFEKFLCFWLLTSIGWVLLHTTVYTIYTIVVNQLGHLIFSEITFLPFSPLGGYSVITIKCYLILHGIFLIGAAHFKGYAFPKTLVVIVIFAMVLGTISYLIMVDLFMADHVCNGEECELITIMGVHPVWLVIDSFFWWLLAPLSWVITYIGLKDQEV